jgi:dihydrofolate reductase
MVNDVVGFHEQSTPPSRLLERRLSDVPRWSATSIYPVILIRHIAEVSNGRQSTLEAAMQKVGAGRTAFIIGGAELYAHALQKAERLELTEIAAEYPGDAHFPDIDRTQWHEVCRQAGQSTAGLGYAFVTYERTQST